MASQNAKDRLVGAAVQRPFQRADGRGHGRMHIRKRRGDNPGRECGSVEFVVGVQDESDIERAFGGFGRLGAIQQQQKIGRVRKRRIGIDHLLPFSQAVVGRHDHGDLRSQAEGFVQVGVVIVLLVLRIVKRQRRNRGAQHVHGRSVPGSGAHQVDDGRIQLALCRQLLAEFLQFGLRGQLAIPQQVAGFFEVGVVGKFVNVDAAVGEDALISVDVADAGIGSDYSFQALGGVGGGQAGHVPSLENLKRR